MLAVIARSFFAVSDTIGVRRAKLPSNSGRGPILPIGVDGELIGYAQAIRLGNGDRSSRFVQRWHRRANGVNGCQPGRRVDLLLECEKTNSDRITQLERRHGYVIGTVAMWAALTAKFPFLYKPASITQ
jgi:hypothetical protein